MSAKPFITAIIAAAGSSLRMNGINKLLFEIDGVPVIARTIDKFNKNDNITEIVISAKSSDVDTIKKIVSRYNFTKVRAVVDGGETRAQSVQNSVSASSDKTEYFAIHDGARPLITSRVIDETIKNAIIHHAAVAGVRVKDTIKVVNGGFIESTPERSTLWAVHTPQIFEKALYLEAIASAESCEREITDDSMLVEMLGIKVFMVNDEYSNIKITTPDDLSIVEQYIKGDN
ncbi:MAG: 2-C-methyl-D-erythritol 4-phosphate cytidylyltransferase [Clostridia bacterium]|nr:2-C-methyl-D-erythritol 4-phosphate cytidylyltransferase [Clostridia bacterium]